MAESNEQSGTRRLMMGGAILSAVVFKGRWTSDGWAASISGSRYLSDI
jgi:hypothetical protein